MATEEFVKFPRTPHLDDMGSASRDDLVLSKADALKMLARGVVIEEKVDGANLGISFSTVDGPPRCQKRGHWITHQSEHQFCKLESWLAQHTDSLRQALGTRYILYGEWVAARHSVTYDALPDWFLAFDIYDKQTMKFASCRRRDALLRNTHVRSVPSVVPSPGRAFHGPNALESVRQLVQGLRSALCVPGSDQWAEGIVLRVESSEDEDESVRQESGFGGCLLARAKLVHPSFQQALEGTRPLGGGAGGGGAGMHWSKRTIQWNNLRPDLWPWPDPDSDLASNPDLGSDPEVVTANLPGPAPEPLAPVPAADLDREDEIDPDGPGLSRAVDFVGRRRWPKVDAAAAEAQQSPVAAAAAGASTEVRSVRSVTPATGASEAAAAAADPSSLSATRLTLVGGGYYVSLIGSAIDAVADWFTSQPACVPPGHVANRVLRDGPRHHITLVTPPEMAELREQYGMEPEQVYDTLLATVGQTGGAWVPIGLGRVRSSETEDETLFVVVAWPAGRCARAALGLHREHHFHITLGFQMQDVHGVPKGLTTLKGGHLDELVLESLSCAARSAGARLTPADQGAVLVLQVLTELQQSAQPTTAWSAVSGGSCDANKNPCGSTGVGGGGSGGGTHVVVKKGSTPGIAVAPARKPTFLAPHVMDCLYGILRFVRRLVTHEPIADPAIAKVASTDVAAAAGAAAAERSTQNRAKAGMYDCCNSEYELRRLFIGACTYVALARLAGWCGELEEVDEHVRQAEVLAEAVGAAVDSWTIEKTARMAMARTATPQLPGNADVNVVLAAAACLYGKACSQRNNYAEAASAFNRAASALDRVRQLNSDGNCCSLLSKTVAATTKCDADLVHLLRGALVTPSLESVALRAAATSCCRRLASQQERQHQQQIQIQIGNGIQEGQLRNTRERTVVPGVMIGAGGGGGGAVLTDVLLPRNTSWVAPAVLAGGSTPKRPDQIAALRSLNVGLIITLTEEEPLPSDWFNESPPGCGCTGTATAAPTAAAGTGAAVASVRNLFVPVINYEPPSVRQMDEILAAIEDHVAVRASASTEMGAAAGSGGGGGGAVLVHCGGGKGRAGTVLACYLCKYGQAPPPRPPPLPSPLRLTQRQRQPQGEQRTGMAMSTAAADDVSVRAPAMSADAAVRLIRELRPGSIETEQQRRFVGQYCDLLWRRYDRAMAGNSTAASMVAEAVDAPAPPSQSSSPSLSSSAAAAAAAAVASGIPLDFANNEVAPASGSGHCAAESHLLTAPSQSRPTSAGQMMTHAGQTYGPTPPREIFSSRTASGSSGTGKETVLRQQQHEQNRQQEQQHRHGQERTQCRQSLCPPQQTLPPPPVLLPVPLPPPPPPPSRQLPRLAMLVGLPGSGKSTFSRALEASGRWTRICQDECGSRGSAEAAFSSAMLRGPSSSGHQGGWRSHVVLDRCSPDAVDRKEWFKLALLGRRDKGIVAVFFDVDPVLCKARVAARTDHPTISQGRGGRIVDSFAARLQPPTLAEGFERVYVIRDPRDAASLLAAWGATAVDDAGEPLREVQGAAPKARGTPG